MTAREVVTIDNLPVEVSSTRWAKDPEGVTAEIREKRQAVQYPAEDIETMPKAPSYDEVMGDE